MAKGKNLKYQNVSTINFPSCHLASHCLVLVVICDFAIWLPVKGLISTTLKLLKEAGAKEQRVIRIDAARPPYGWNVSYGSHKALQVLELVKMEPPLSGLS